jgi:hypothetical protein
LSDGLEPANSHDQTIRHFSWRPKKGSLEWVQYELAQPRKVRGVSVYWADDAGPNATTP